MSPGPPCRDCSCPHLRPGETEEAPSRRRPPAFLTWYCAAGPAGPIGRKAAAPGTPMPPEGPGPRRAGLGSIPGPAGGGGAPRAAATAPPPGLSGGNGNPPAPRPDIALSRPAVQRSGLRAVSVESAPRAAFRDPGLSDFMAGFRDFLFQVRQVLHGPALGAAAPRAPLLSGRLQIRDVLPARRPLPAPGGMTARVQLPRGGNERPAPPRPGLPQARPLPAAQSGIPLQIPPLARPASSRHPP